MEMLSFVFGFSLAFSVVPVLNLQIRICFSLCFLMLGMNEQFILSGLSSSAFNFSLSGFYLGMFSAVVISSAFYFSQLLASWVALHIFKEEKREENIKLLNTFFSILTMLVFLNYFDFEKVVIFSVSEFSSTDAVLKLSAVAKNIFYAATLILVYFFFAYLLLYSFVILANRFIKRFVDQDLILGLSFSFVVLFSSMGIYQASDQLSEVIGYSLEILAGE